MIAVATADRWTTLLILFVAEALAWAGVPAIGAAAIGAAGALASQGTLHLWAVVVIGTAGSWLGGLAGWHIGHRVARAGLDRPQPGRFADKRTRALGSGERVAQRWGRYMVFFVPSWVSGALAMPFRQFAVWNLVAAFLWILAAGLGAYGIGSAASGGSLVETLLPLLASVAAAGLLGLAFVRWRRQRSPPVREAS